MIPYLDLKAQYLALKPEIDRAIEAVLESSTFVLGPAVEQFEEAFARYTGTTHAVGVNSGTSALHLALLAVGVRPGDEVITVPYTFVATVAAIEYAQATPVFVDIEPRYFGMDPSLIERAITPRTKAIVPVHLYGQSAEMDPIVELARRRGLAVVEDACQAHGADYNGRRCGSMGAIGCFSFYPGKNLGAYGEGGAAVTSDPHLAETMRTMRSWGERRRYEHEIRGFNYRMDGIQAAVLGVKLRHLEDWIEARRTRAADYRRVLAGSGVRTPEERPGSRHVYHLFAVRVAGRDRVRQHLASLGIATGVHYPIPVHLQPAYRDLGYRGGDFPVAEAVASEVLSLPIYPELTMEQILEVAGACRAAAREADRASGPGRSLSQVSHS